MKCRMCGERDAITGFEMCERCDREWKQDQAKIDKLVASGHAEHCACRQVWGDGECECDLYAAGYNPYAWIEGVAQ